MTGHTYAACTALRVKYVKRRKEKALRRNLAGEIVRKLRDERALSQYELAARCQRMGWDISRDIVAAIERGVRCVTEIELFGLAEALGVKADRLLPDRPEALKLLCEK